MLAYVFPPVAILAQSWQMILFLWLCGLFMASVADTLRDRILYLCRASRCLTKAELDEVVCTGQLAKEFLLEQAYGFVRSAGTAPVLLQYQGDGTPQLVRHRCVSQVTSHRVVVREGGAGKEFFCQAAFLVMDLDQQLRHRMVVCEPRVLDGKTNWHLQTAIREFFPWLHKAGHTAGINIQVFALDRAPLSAVARRLRQAHHLYWRSVESRAEDPHWALHEQASWTLFVGCGCHDVHNGALHGLMSLVTYPELLKDLHVGIASIRNGYVDIHTHLGSWLKSTLLFVEHPAGTEEDFVFFWTLLGVEPDIAQQLAERRIMFRLGKLEVWDRFRGDAEVLPFITGTMLLVMQFRKFTEGRFLSIGSIMRNLVSSLALGLGSLLQYTLDDPKVSSYYLGGTARFNASVFRYAGVAALATRPADAVLSALFEDDRAVLHCHRYRTAMDEEVAYLWSVPDKVWSFVVEALPAEVSSIELRSDTIRSAAVSCAYISKVFFGPLRQLPWSLATSENIEAQVLDLWSLDEPPLDDTAARIWQLGRVGFDLADVVRAVRLFRQVRFSTTVAEQIHGITSALHRYHKMYAEGTLAMRALLSYFKQLLPEEGVRDRREEMSLRRWVAMDRRQPRRVSGYSLFCGSWVQQFKQSTSPSSPLPRSYLNHAMKAAAREWWHVTTPEVRHAWNNRAIFRRDENVGILAGDLATELAMEAIHGMRDEQEDMDLSEFGPVVRFDTCRLSQDELLCLALALQDGPTKAEVHRRRAAQREPPGVPCDAARQAMVDLGDLGANLELKLPDCQAWERTVALVRDRMDMCVLAFGSLVTWQYYLFLYASRSPFFVGLAPLRLVEHPRSEFQLEQRFAPLSGCEPFDWMWRLLPGEFIHSFELQGVVGEGVLVIPHAVAFHRGYIASHGRPMSLAAFAAFIPAASGASKTVRDRSSTGANDDLSLGERFPWTRRWAREGGGDRGASGCPSVPVAESGLSDEQIEDISTKVDLMRRGWHDEHGHGATDFRCELTGGAWAKANLGVEIDGVRASARGMAMGFCSDFGLTKSASHSFKVYGERLANVLALEWCCKMQFFFDSFQAEGADTLCSDVFLATYKASVAFERSCSEEPRSEGRFHARADLLRALKPSSGKMD